MDFNTISLLIFGLTILIIGGNLLLKAAVSISMKFGIPKLLIGMTVVSLATSAPELIVSIKSAIKGSPDLAISNVLGSNIFNVFAVLGITSLVTPLSVLDQNIIDFDIYIMLFFAAIILPLIFFPKKLVLGRKEGIIILMFYSIYVYQLFY
jgi:cation:H+ antiporter